MQKDALRLARFLRGGSASARATANGRTLILENARGALAFSSELVAEMARRALIAMNGTTVTLTDSGSAFERRLLTPVPDYQAQHREIDEQRIEIGGDTMPVSVNRNESPLAAIARRRLPDGRTFLTAPEFRAGERLRADYTRGQLLPRLGANWQAAVASGRRAGDAGGGAELTDAALAARQRVDKALQAVGPELGGILVDICCYLKGLETVERERSWPARSAKIVLKSALGALARHYDPHVEQDASRRRVTLHWGAADYRPSMK